LFNRRRTQTRADNFTFPLSTPSIRLGLSLDKLTEEKPQSCRWPFKMPFCIYLPKRQVSHLFEAEAIQKFCITDALLSELSQTACQFINRRFTLSRRHLDDMRPA
jgi:hypothetical protein